jgi:hypothetical protein
VLVIARVRIAAGELAALAEGVAERARAGVPAAGGASLVGF